MKKIILTSAGFENKKLEQVFLTLAGKPPQNIKALFIPTAAISPDAIAVLPKCMNDLLQAGIPPQSIAVFDLHRNMSYEELSVYDTVYLCGGDTRYLLSRINDSGFSVPFKRFAEERGVYVGVSAGSIVAAGNVPGNLGYLAAQLNVHQPFGTKPGAVDCKAQGHISLTNRQAIVINGDACDIVE